MRTAWLGLIGRLCLLGFGLPMVGCGSEGETSQASSKAPAYPITEQRYTTLQQVWWPKEVPASTLAERNAGTFKINDLDRYTELGFGVELGPGEPWIEHDELAPGWQSHTSGTRRSLLFFWHSSDPQVVDEESPIRLEGVTGLSIGSTYRPQDHLVTQAFESQVRTVRAIMEDLQRPLDFTIVTGDLADGGQYNELDWVFKILEGGTIDPDSGKDDDPVKGPGNDYNDPYVSLGIGMPWYVTIGNHEVQYTGIADASQEVQDAAKGSEVFQGLEYFAGIAPAPGVEGGFRDGSTPNADVTTQGPTPADPDRYIPDLPELVSILSAEPGDPVGHGYSTEDVDAGRGNYSFHPVEGLPLRIIALNTLSLDIPGSEGAIDDEQWAWLQQELDAADQAHEIVFVASHHAAESIKLGGHKRADVEALLASHDNVVLHLCGHSHTADSEVILPDAEAAAGHRGYWQVQTPSTLDFPMQTRFWELVDEGDGFVTLYATILEQNAPEDSLAHKARQIAAGHGWFQNSAVREDFAMRAAHRNLKLHFKLPDDVAAGIAAAPAKDSIASEDTLANY
ncbi:MAG: metallophosphoesterase [Polyangiaceae bacterium]|nr:metallophosphoesterase [Polyangiaceae bacterium]MCB9606266.1 metallophosphoesterase [Polyangiaceae bacterium]